MEPFIYPVKKISLTLLLFSLPEDVTSPILFQNCQGDSYFIHSGYFHFKFDVSSSESLGSSIKPETRTDVSILILHFNIFPFGIANGA